MNVGEDYNIFEFNSKKYKVDLLGFLINPIDWDLNFAQGLAKTLNIHSELTEDHIKVIDFIRDYFFKYNVCPNIYTTCRNNSLRLKDIRKLFPTGYQRGACKISGISYAHGYLTLLQQDSKLTEYKSDNEKIYKVTSQGFLISPKDWDEKFAIEKALELKIPSGLTDKHWEIIKYIRTKYEGTGVIPNVYQLCENFNLEIDDLEKLFPDGYNRGAVKISGLRIL